MAGALRSKAIHRRIQIIDSHTAGEPTRVVIAGGPDLRTGTICQRLERFRTQHDSFRSALVNEPRGTDVIVGALLLEPVDASCTAGVIFFNNVGYLAMCGHGMIGVMATLAHLGRASAGRHRIETPVGIVTATLHDANQASIQNVASYRHARDVSVDVEGHGTVTGDVAWGGNWFFLVQNHGQRLEHRNVEALTDFCWGVRKALNRAGITGASSAEIDHIEMIAPSPTPGVHARNFVLCPGGAYDRSPCGTGTSAKVACLVSDGKLKPGEVWRQESIIGSVFEASVEVHDGAILPTIKGSAYVTAEATLLLNPADPFCWGIPTRNR
jgi:4-hydroxyproline epimerase